jgi:hypothetical protein
MNRLTLMKALNPVLAFLVTSQIVTGASNRHIPHHVFKIVHESAGFLIGGAIALHVVLNWNWVKVNLLRRHPRAMK